MSAWPYKNNFERLLAVHIASQKHILTVFEDVTQIARFSTVYAGSWALGGEGPPQECPGAAIRPG